MLRKELVPSLSYEAVELLRASSGRWRILLLHRSISGAESCSSAARSVPAADAVSPDRSKSSTDPGGYATSSDAEVRYYYGPVYNSAVHLAR